MLREALHQFFVIGYFWAVKRGQRNRRIDLNWTKTYWFQLIEFNLRPKSTRMLRGLPQYLIRNSYCSLFENCMLYNATLYVSERISVSPTTSIALFLFFFFKNDTVLVSAILFISRRSFLKFLKRVLILKWYLRLNFVVAMNLPSR